MVFDLDDKESFLNLTKWEKILKENGIDNKKSVIFLVGNKADLKSKVKFLLLSKYFVSLLNSQ